MSLRPSLGSFSISAQWKGFGSERTATSQDVLHADSRGPRPTTSLDLKKAS